VNGKVWQPVCSPEPGDSLDPSPGRLTGRSAKSTGTGGNALGTHAAGRHELLDVVTLAIGTLWCRIAGAYNKFLKTMAARFALVLVNGHFPILSKIFHIIIVIAGMSTDGLVVGMPQRLVLCPAGNLQNTDRFYQFSYSTNQVSGVGCQVSDPRIRNCEFRNLGI
jgi:hypothetical protein